MQSRNPAVHASDEGTEPRSSGGGTKRRAFPTGFGTRAVLTFVAFVALVITAATFTFSAPVSAAPDAGRPRYADVVIQFGDRETVVRSIVFNKKKITGLQALELTGLDVVRIDTQYGPAICSIEGVGMPADNCFGDPQGRYWGYNYWDGSAWQGYMIGAGESKVKNGAVEGWRYGQFGDSMYPAGPVLAANKALKWLQKQQSNTTGGYAGAPSSVDTALAISANDIAAKNWQRNANAPSLATFLKQNARKYSKLGASSAGKLALALTSAKVCFQKKTRLPDAYYDSSTGKYHEGAGHQAFAILGTAALGAVPADAVTFLKSIQQPNGGWEWQPTWGTDTNTTALALQALVATGEPLNSTAITNALAYLDTAQNADGGFPFDPDSSITTESDGNSTAWVIQALTATGQDPFGPDWTQNATSVAFLESLQLPNGSFEWMAGSGTANLLATQQAIIALMGRSLIPSGVTAHKECPKP